jgi:hypothetical protein
MKITLEGLDGRNFTLRLPRDAGGEHVIALHDTRRLRGLYDHDAARFSLDPVEADALTGEVAWVLAAGTLHLGGPAALGATRLDLEIRRDDQRPGVTGSASCASLDAPVTRLHRAGLELYGGLAFTALDARYDAAADAWALAAETLGARGASLAREGLSVRFEGLDARAVTARFGDATTLAAAELSAAGLSLTRGELTVAAAGARLTGLRVTRDAAEALVVEVGGVELSDVEVTRGQVSARAPSLRLDALRSGPDGLTIGQALADALSVAVGGLGAGAPAAEPTPAAEPAPTGGRQTLGVDLPFLDHLGGRLEADVVVDMKLPVLERRVATHRLRLDLREGSLDFKQLEGGLSPLENAILDFEVVDAGLELELDAVLVKRQLVLWPLDAEGQRLARQGRVRLRTFAQPTVTARAPAAPRAEEGGDAPVALRRLEVQNLRADLALSGASTLSLGGATLRLGAEGAPALGSLRANGSVVYDPAAAPPETAVTFELADLDLGLDALALGDRRLDVARARVGQLAEGELTLRGVAPTGASMTLRALDLRGVTLRSP